MAKSKMKAFGGGYRLSDKQAIIEEFEELIKIIKESGPNEECRYKGLVPDKGFGALETNFKLRWFGVIS